MKKILIVLLSIAFLGTASAQAEMKYKPGSYVKDVDGTKKYFNCKGEDAATGQIHLTNSVPCPPASALAPSPTPHSSAIIKRKKK